MKERSYNIRYMMVHGFYQMLVFLVSSCASVYLLSKGYTDGGIGVILAVANAASAVLMPAMGSFLDAHPKISLRVFAVGMLGISIVISGLMLLFKGGSMTLSVLMVLILTLMMSFQALVNSLCFLLENRGIHLNFGLGRGCGSATFAVVSAVLGIVMKSIDPGILPLFYIAAFIFLGFAYVSIKVPSQVTENEEGRGDQVKVQGEALSFGKFVVTYKKYMLFLLGSCLIMMFLMASGANFTYQILVSIGGGTEELGYALAIAAIVELPAMILCDKMVRKYTARWVLRMSALFYIVKFMILLSAATWAKSVWLFYVGQMFQFASFGFFFPCAATYTAQLLPEADMVKGQSLFTAMTAVAGFLAALAGGFLLDLTSVGTMLIVMFFVAIVGFIIIWFNVEKTGADRQ